MTGNKENPSDNLNHRSDFFTEIIVRIHRSVFQGIPAAVRKASETVVGKGVLLSAKERLLLFSKVFHKITFLKRKRRKFENLRQSVLFVENIYGYYSRLFIL